MKKVILEVEEIFDQATPLVEKRWKEFVELGQNGSEEELFNELSFCVLTANWSAKGGIRAQKEIGNGFVNFTKEELEAALKRVGHRFPHARAEYIYSNRWLLGSFREILKMPVFQAREYIVKNVKGIGWKEASHFLRNVGKEEVAILDKHILKLMLNSNIVDEIPKGWSKKKYLDYESRLKPIAEHFNVSLGKLDLYLWYTVKKSVDK
ncbi:N-glycosylase/DNA lyase [Mesoaciditoga sp.]